MRSMSLLIKILTEGHQPPVTGSICCVYATHACVVAGAYGTELSAL